MSAVRVPPRIPAGWTREAAGLVWADWRAARDGRIPYFGSPSSWMTRQSWREIAAVPGVVCAEYEYPTAGIQYSAAWVSDDARLRAWAAVGAPVLAPAEDGKPSLAEWVAAAEGSALGRPSWSAWKAFFSRPHRHRIDCELLDDGSALVTDWGDHFSQWAAMPFSTPAELRACLDRLAGGVS